MHFQTLDAVKNLDTRTGLTLSQDEGVIDEPISPVGVACAVATNPSHSSSLRRNMLKHISHHVRIFSSRSLADVLVPVGVRTNQFNLTVKTTGDPVVIDLIAFGATLYAVAAILIV